MTSEDTWDPHSTRFQEQEILCTSDSRPASTRMESITAVNIAEDGRLYDRLISKVSISSAGDSVPDRHISSDSCRFCCERAQGFLIGFQCNDCIAEHHPDYVRSVHVTRTGTDPSIKPEVLAERWGIGLEAARATIQVTTQKGIRHAVHPVQRRFQSQPYLQKPTLMGKWFSDTAFFKVKGLAGETCAQVTTNGKGYGRFWSMKSKRQASDGLIDLINNDGIP